MYAQHWPIPSRSNAMTVKAGKPVVVQNAEILSAQQESPLPRIIFLFIDDHNF